jgi:flagellar hook-associated protein 2
MAISSPGLGSGLDVTGIVSQLMAIERQPLIRLDQKEAKIQAEISSYGSLKGVLATLQNAMDKLGDPKTYQATNASSSNAEVLTATSSTDATASSYNITVNRLAQAHKLGSTEFASSTTFGGTAGGELNITVGANSFTLDLSTAMTLTEIQVAINVESNATGITAGLITGDSGNQTLVLTSGDTGYEDRIQLSFDGSIDANTFGFTMLNRDADGQLLASENDLNASMTVDGVNLTRGGNNISDVVEGLTFELQSQGQAKVNIGQDTLVARQAVEAFISAYNKVKDQLTTLAASGVNGSVLRGVEYQLRGALNNGASGLGEYTYISELGITTNSDTGKLELDSERLMAALKGNPDSVIGFFSDDDSGFATNLDNLLAGFLQSGGTLDSIVNSANSRVEGIERNREAMERRLEVIEQRYLKQFGALDSLMASMTTTSDYLSSQLDMLSNMIKRDDK